MSCIKLETTDRAKMERSVHTINWRLGHFNKICPRTSKKFPTVLSSKICCGEKNGKKLKWNCYIEGKGGNLGLFLQLLPSNWKTVTGVGDDHVDDHTDNFDDPSEHETDELKIVRCSFQIWFGNSQNDLVYSRDSATEVKFTSKDLSWGRQKFISISELYMRRKELLENDTLRVTIKLTIFQDINWPIFVVDHLPTGLGDWFLSEKFSDVKINCSGECFNCHKIILADRSRVFNTIFDNGLEEYTIDEIDIDDMKPTVVKSILQYIYTETVDLPEDCDWSELIYGAEKYDLEELKYFCLEKMFQEVTNDNVASLVIMADTYNAEPEHKETLRTFCKNNIKELMDSSNFRKVLAKNFHLFYPEDDEVAEEYWE